MASIVVGLLGKAGAGKDTVAARLVAEHGFTRVAFADPLKAAALKIDPIVRTGAYGSSDAQVRMSEFVATRGWDEAKKTLEVRRFLQNLGSAMREVDPDVWINRALVTILEVKGPVVVTDVRHVNEAEAIDYIGAQAYLQGHISPQSPAAGGLLARVVRPGQHGLEGVAANDISETALDDFEVEHTILNSGSLDDLNEAADVLARYALDPHRGAGGWI